MKHLLIILSILILSSPLFGQSEKPQTIIIPTGSIGEMSEARIKILEKTLESKLDDYFAIIPKDLFEEAQEQAFEELEYDECTEDQCIMLIKEILQIENAFKMDLIIDEGDTQISITWNDQDQKRVEEDYCEGCKTKGLRLMIGGLVEKLVGKKVIGEPVVLVDKKKKGVLFESIRDGDWKWIKDGDEELEGKYVGEIENGIPNGQGTLTWKNPHEKYVGQWNNGLKHGQGTYSWANGWEYVGDWKDGKRNGEGTYSHSDGNKYVGTYKDGERNGLGTFYYPNGDKYVGEWKGERQNGQGTWYLSNGNKWIGEMKNGRDWNTTGYDKNGNIIGKVVNGVKQ